MSKLLKNPHFNAIPTKLTLDEFNEFVLLHFTQGTRGPKPTLSLHKIFSYILNVLYMGMQWNMLPIEKDGAENPEIHYTHIFKKFIQWVNDGSFERIFRSSVEALAQRDLIDWSALHGDEISSN